MRLLLLLIALVTCFIAMVSFGETIPYNQHRHNSASYTINNIGDKSKDVCYAVNVIHSADNENVPYNLTDVREHYKGLYKELGESQSILHNFRTDVQKLLTTPKARIEAALNAFLDFHARPKILWTVLDPDLPNVKFVEINGHKEVVYNKYTGEKVAGVNAGTYNRAINQSSDLHAFVDVPLWFLCGTPTETQEEFARILAKDENLYKEFSKVTDSIVNDFMKSFGMEDDMIINLRSLLQGMQAKEEKEDVAEMFSRPVLSENPLAKTKKANNDMCYEDSQKNDEDAVNNSNKDNVAKTDIDEAKDSTDKGMSPESVTVDTNDDGGVGVRGWCKCVNNDDDVIAVGFGGKTSKASYTDEEHELMRSRFKASRFHSYVYFICRQCGRCSTKGKIGGSGPLKNLSIFDFTLAEQFEEEKKTKVMSDSDYRRHNAMMIGVNKKLLTIPEGQIVIPGSCLCLKPDLVTVGLAASDKFQVCRYCGWKWVSAKE